MKKILLFTLLLPASLWAFQKNNGGSNQKPGTITLICRVYGVPANLDSMYVYENMGLANRVVARGSRRALDSAYVLTVPVTTPKFYLVGANELSTTKVILGGEKEVTLWGNSQFMQKARTVNSPANMAFEKLQTQIADLQTQGTQLRAQFNVSNGNARPPAEAQLVKFGKSKLRILDSLKLANPLLWRFASLQLTPDYTGQGAEYDFYGKEYFQNAPLTDKAFEEIPEVFYAFERYTAQLLNLGASQEQAVALAEAQLAKIPAGSRTRRMAMGGVVSMLKNANSNQYPIMAKKYIDLYRNSNNGEIPRLEMELRRAGTQTTGLEAPDLAGMTPDSTNYSLKQMRGKIVMIDFWASWCGPCRKENPNVVANYHKYKDKGFDILGVSLDRDIASWRKAIEADGLPWHHISDLKGWQSAHAALYSITSIPQTLLLDRDGKIIARNLRGEQLSEKLKEIFGM
jgi:thiol-disulfide isomerase/thioredoxin